MLYELVACVRPGRLNEVREIAKTAGTQILSNRGVVRGYTNWGTFLLPKPKTHHGVKHHNGHYFVMRFDASAKAQHIVRKTLDLDPRLLRYSVVRMGSKLEEVADVGGVAPWKGGEV